MDGGPDLAGGSLAFGPRNSCGDHLVSVSLMSEPTWNLSEKLGATSEKS